MHRICRVENGGRHDVMLLFPSRLLQCLFPENKTFWYFARKPYIHGNIEFFKSASHLFYKLRRTISSGNNGDCELGEMEIRHATFMLKKTHRVTVSSVVSCEAPYSVSAGSSYVV